MSRLTCVFVACLAGGFACADESPSGPVRVPSTRGASVATTHDGRVAVITHRMSGAISVVRFDEAGTPTPVTTIDVGVAAQPWAAVIGADDDSAYVLLRGEQKVVRVRGIRSREPELDDAAWPTGAEPTAIAITPSGARVYVANWGEGTISTFRTDGTKPDQATDLNLILARTGLLGPLTEDARKPQAPIWTDQDFFDLGAVRPGLAHPRALAITDDGDEDDADEVLYATEFFSQPLAVDPETKPEPEADPDRARQGLVYAIDVGTGSPLVAPDSGEALPPIALSALDTGFDDAEGSPTSCFPNQLYAAAVADGRLFVTAMCASPRGPVEPGPDGSPANFMTLVHPTVHVIDTAEHRERPEAALVLTRAMMDEHMDEHGDAEELRMPLIPNDIVVEASDGADGLRAYVTAFGADAVFGIEYDASGVPARVGVAGEPFVDLRPQGQLPTGIALTPMETGRAALVWTDYSDVLASVDLERAKVVGWLPFDGLEEQVPHDVRENRRLVRDGRRLFATGLDNWSFRGEAWSSCESCHPEGLSDGVVWRFARGPRRTISTAGTYYGDPDDPTRRVLLWTANVDEIHDVEGIARGVSGGAGGVSWKPYQTTPNIDCRLLYAGETPREPSGSVDCPRQIPTTLRRNGLNGSLAAITKPTDEGVQPCESNSTTCDINALSDWDEIDAFIRSVRAPRAPTTLVDGYVESGRALFERMRCASCHGGPGWTVSRVFYEPSDATNGAVPATRPAPGAITDTAALRGLLRIASYALPTALAALNAPLASALQANGEALATFRSWAPAAADVAAELDYLYGRADQINCALRSVGTFPAQTPGAAPAFTGVVAPGAAPVQESRRVLDPPAPDPSAAYADLLAAGATGFNVPALTGLALGGAFFHAGNARTLEELFDDTFAAHHLHPAVHSGFAPTPDEVRDLVSFLLSIDDAAELMPLAPFEVDGAAIDADLCGQL